MLGVVAAPVDPLPAAGAGAPVRQERLAASGAADAIRRTHAAFFLALAEGFVRGLVSPEVGSWLSRLAAEHDNLRAALGWALDRGAVVGLVHAGPLE